MKVYIKSVNVADIQAKIAKKQADIDKKKAWIEKKEVAIQKKLDILSPVLSPDVYEQLVSYIDYLKSNSDYKVPDNYDINTWKIARDNGWDYESKIGKALYTIDDDAKSIYNSKQAIAEARKVLDKHNEKLASAKAKADEIDQIPECLKDFMNDIIDQWNEHDLWLKAESKPYYQELKEQAERTLFGEDYDKRGFYHVEQEKLKALYPDFKEGWGWHRSDKFKQEYIEIPFERKYGSLRYARDLWYKSEEEIKAENKKAGENLILDLLKRVTKITGPVVDWNNLFVTQGNMGAVLNGFVIGEDGKAMVESILAGGYNIQRLHVRVLVKPIR